MDAPGDTGIPAGGSPPEGGGEGGQFPGTQAPMTTSAPLVFTNEDLRSHQGLTKFRDVDSLGKSYIELERKLGERPTGVKPLSAESTPEEIAAYRQAMGVPEKPDGYELGELSFPEDVAPTQEQLGAFRNLAHELHLTPAQVKGILTWYSEDLSGQWNGLQEARTAELRDNLSVISKKYGAQAPALVQMASEYVKRRYGQEALDSLEAGPGETKALGNHPLLLEILIENARLTGHDKFIMADSRGGLVDRDSAQQRYSVAAKEYYATQDEARKASLRQEMEQLARIAGS
jgi:hypothetical protein